MPIADLLPLFPLEVVLFPGMPLPLHIFEPRYRQMIAECAGGSSSFGVILDSGGERAEVGCSAQILEVVNRYPDGRLDILTEGRRRFRLLETDAELPYLRGEVEWLDDPEEDVTAERAEVVELYRRTYWAHGQGVPPSQVAADPHASFLVARSNLLALPDRQRLLEIGGESNRLRALTEALRRIEPMVRRMSGNGHGHGST